MCGWQGFQALKKFFQGWGLGFQVFRVREKNFSASGLGVKRDFQKLMLSSALLGQVLWYLDDVSEP